MQRALLTRRVGHPPMVAAVVTALAVPALTVGAAFANSATAAAATSPTAKTASGTAAVKLGQKCPTAGGIAKTSTGSALCVKKGSSLVWTATASGAPAPSAAPSPAPVAGAPAAGAASPAPAPGAAPTGIVGRWVSTTGSQAGYRVKELFTGGVAKVEAVGRTDAVTASMTLVKNGDAYVAKDLAATIDVTKLVSDEPRRDEQMKTIGLQTRSFPTATFAGSSDIKLPADIESGNPVSLALPGRLTLHGVTRSVEFAADARLRNGNIEVIGRLAIKLPDYGIEPPDIVDMVKADDDGVIEIRLAMTRG